MQMTHVLVSFARVHSAIWTTVCTSDSFPGQANEGALFCPSASGKAEQPETSLLARVSMCTTPTENRQGPGPAAAQCGGTALARITTLVYAPLLPCCIAHTTGSGNHDGRRNATVCCAGLAFSLHRSCTA
jgi:hypothetical protein